MTSRTVNIGFQRRMTTAAADRNQRYLTRWRVLDIACSLAAILLLAPVFALIALLILMDGGRPILFSQLRVGQNGRLFTLWKFRTMRPVRGNRITALGDSRITPVGAWLRKLKLDELPQLFNVLKGDMSLIGPRPEIPEFVDRANALWCSTLSAKPGITDLASLIFRNEENLLARAHDPEEHYRRTVLPMKLLLNQHYIQSRCWRLDLELLFLTALYSFFPWTFNLQRIEKTFCLGVNVIEPNFLHPIPRSLDR